MRRAAALAVGLALLAAAPAGAADVSAAELRALADRAQRDPGAASQLRGVTSVDGRPVAPGALDAEGAELAARARTLADEAVVPPAAAGGDPRATARDVLGDRRYRGSGVPRPFKRPLGWLGDRIEGIMDWFERRFEDLVGAVPGGRPVAWGLVAGLVLLVALLASRRLVARRAALGGGDSRRRASAREDPRDLERAADRAERDGDWPAAVRLRFRAGLLRLDAADVIAYRPSLTTGEVAAAVRSPEFDAVGADFDAIAYGGRPAGAADATAARERWAAVLAEAPHER